MARSAKPAAAPQVRHCLTCKQDFAVYKSSGFVVQCPRCGRTASMPLHRRRLRLLAVAILVAAALAYAAVKILNP